MELVWGLEACGAALLGLLVGSFLTTVIHRLPRMMDQDFAAECTAHHQTHCHCSAMGADAAATAPLTLTRPRSHCPHCSQSIAWHDRIPVLSYLVLRGRCRSCHTRISLRYPLVELATAAGFAFCTARWGFSPTGLAWCGFSAALLTLALIDWDTELLPDSITLPLVWAGVLASALAWTGVALPDAVFGAAAGYLSLWLVYWGCKLLTGKEGMGYGDFKLFAALGAWLGWQALVPLLLIASLSSVLVALPMLLFQRLREGGYIPFGPFLAGAGFAAMVFGSDTVLRSLFALAGM